jgi:hypothetical protein
MYCHYVVVGWKNWRFSQQRLWRQRYSILKGSTMWKFKHLTEEDVHPDCSAIFNGPSPLIEELLICRDGQGQPGNKGRNSGSIKYLDIPLRKFRTNTSAPNHYLLYWDKVISVQTSTSADYLRTHIIRRCLLPISWRNNTVIRNQPRLYSSDISFHTKRKQ